MPRHTDTEARRSLPPRPRAAYRPGERRLRTVRRSPVSRLIRTARAYDINVGAEMLGGAVCVALLLVCALGAAVVL